MFAAGEQATEVVEVGTGSVAVHERRQRHVQNDVRVQRQDVVDVGGRGDAEVIDAGQRAGIEPDLVGVGDEEAHDLHVRPSSHRRDRGPPDVPTPPLHDPDRHPDNVGDDGTDPMRRTTEPDDRARRPRSRPTQPVSAERGTPGPRR